MTHSPSVLGPARGLQAEYFASDQLGGTLAFRALDPGVSTDRVTRRWYGAMPDVFSVQWFGYLTAPRSGRYTFALTSDDAAALSVDGRRLIDNGGRHAATTRTDDETFVAEGIATHNCLVAQWIGEFNLPKLFPRRRLQVAAQPRPSWLSGQRVSPLRSVG